MLSFFYRISKNPIFYSVYNRIFSIWLWFETCFFYLFGYFSCFLFVKFLFSLCFFLFLSRLFVTFWNYYFILVHIWHTRASIIYWLLFSESFSNLCCMSCILCYYYLITCVYVRIYYDFRHLISWCWITWKWRRLRVKVFKILQLPLFECRKGF